MCGIISKNVQKENRQSYCNSPSKISWWHDQSNSHGNEKQLASGQMSIKEPTGFSHWLDVREKEVSGSAEVFPATETQI